MREFKDRLQYLIDSEKISQRDLAEKLETNEARISEWLSGKVSKPRRTTLIKISEHFNCSTEWLAEGLGSQVPSLDIKTAENVASFEPYKVARDADLTLAKIMREKFKQQCAVYFDEFFDFIAENYGESKEGIDHFLAELHNSHANYRIWLLEKKQPGGDTTIPPPGILTANGI